MKKAVKKAVGVAAGAGLGYLVMGELIYEAVLNIKVNDVINKTGLFDKPEEKEFYDNCKVYQDSLKWFDSLGIADTVIPSRIGKDTKAKVILADEETGKWAIVIHGYTSSPRGMAHYAWKYHTMGFNVVMPHMVGHGPDNRSHCSMGYYDRFIILDWIDYIVGLDPKAKILMHGVSMGSATTMLVTGEDLPSNVVAAVADCGYTNCWDEYASQMKAMFHLPLFPFLNSANTVSKLRKNFDFRDCSPIDAVAHSKTPTFFVHGDSDTFVPYSMMKPLYEACSAPDKEMLTVPKAFHANSAFEDTELYWNKVTAFLDKYFKEDKVAATA
ncbi:MAG: alpha/beta hydrolase [Clostridium sp.]|nr:alpha/beta hydrolase [Clostridium sp.]